MASRANHEDLEGDVEQIGRFKRRKPCCPVVARLDRLYQIWYRNAGTIKALDMDARRDQDASVQLESQTGVWLSAPVHSTGAFAWDAPVSTHASDWDPIL